MIQTPYAEALTWVNDQKHEKNNELILLQLWDIRIAEMCPFQAMIGSSRANRSHLTGLAFSSSPSFLGASAKRSE